MRAEVDLGILPKLLCSLVLLERLGDALKQRLALAAAAIGMLQSQSYCESNPSSVADVLVLDSGALLVSAAT